MHIHEYQAKALLSKYQIAHPRGIVVRSVHGIKDALKDLGGNSWVVKAQVHAGGRAKSGGIVFCNHVGEVILAAKNLINQKLTTAQTDKNGLVVREVLIEIKQNIITELYISFLIDRSTRKIIILASTKGGVNIEEIAKKSPEFISKTFINLCIGLADYQCRQISFMLSIPDKMRILFSQMLKNLYRLFIEKDLILMEINPLVITQSSELLALDAKMEFDDNALYRNQDILAFKNDNGNISARAEAYKLSYIRLDGDIGCMVNGAGLAMATMDLIDYYGGSPANFLDIGGNATAEKVAKAFEIMTESKKLAAILVNIFGGIVRCDLIATGILRAFEILTPSVPIVVRLEGTNAKKALLMLENSPYNIETQADLILATKKVITLSEYEHIN